METLMDKGFSAPPPPRRCKLLKGFSAFTLAEVLIVIGIIGMIADMTIPTLVSNYQKQVAVTQLKKAYSSIFQTIALATIDNGDYTNWELGEDKTIEGASHFASTFLAPYLNLLKNCGTKTTNECALSMTMLDGTAISDTGLAHYTRLLMANGSALIIRLDNSDTQKMATILVDVNGQKKPNTWGKDIFFMQYWFDNVEKTKIGKIKLPAAPSISNAITNTTDGCNKTASGAYCGGLIQGYNWKIPTKEEYVKLGGTAAKYPW